MPLQAVLRPFANGEKFWKMQPTKNDFVVVYFPAATNHDEKGRRIGPMHDSDRQRMELALASRHVKVPVRRGASRRPRRKVTSRHTGKSTAFQSYSRAQGVIVPPTQIVQ